MSNTLKALQDRTRWAVEHTDIDHLTLKHLVTPQTRIQERIELRRDDGSSTLLEAYRTQYSRHRGPAKGGVRFHQRVTAEEVDRLAYLMTLKCALMDLPLGGGKGGVAVDPKSLSDAEREEVSRKYINVFESVIGPKRDVPAPDVSTGPQEMAWMLDELQNAIGTQASEAVTGKPAELGGIPGRSSATGKGGFFVLQRLSGVCGLNLENAAIAIQGFGNAGRHFARAAHEQGCRIVALSDSSGCLTDDNGLDVDKLADLKASGHALADYDGRAHKSESDTVLSRRCDILVLAALGGVITKSNAQNVEAACILELANEPISADADEILKDNGINVIPDILANAGGVIVSHLEWESGKSGNRPTQADVQNHLETYLTNACDRVRSAMIEENVNCRDAALQVAVRHLEGAVLNNL